MRIKLKNFRCYEDKTFDFGETGLTLLSGASGKGKSSVLLAINFALFGVGTKITAYGKTSCTVELEFDGLKIVRTKRPNRLVVNDIYEDASAQEIINKKFGDTFDVTGYIQQNSLNSFILMSPVDKLAFLEKFAFKDIDLIKIKSRCKAHISKQHDELISVVSQLDMAKTVLSEMDIPNEVKFPIKCKREQRERVIQNETIKHKNCNTLIKRTEKLKEKTQIELSHLKVLLTAIETRQDNLSEITKKLSDIESEISSCSYIGDKCLNKYEEQLKTYLQYKELYVLENRLEEDIKKLENMKIQELQGMETELNRIRESLWKEYSKQELFDTMSDLKKALVDMEKVESLRKEVKKCTVNIDDHQKHKTLLDDNLKDLEKYRVIQDEILARREIYSCPSCKCKLRLMNKELSVCTLNDNLSIDNIDIDTVSDRIEEIKRTISKLQRVIPIEEEKMRNSTSLQIEIQNILDQYDEVPVIGDIKNDLDYLRVYDVSQRELETRKNNIELSIKSEKLSSSYTSFKNGVKKLQQQVDAIKSKVDTDIDDIDEESLRKRINDQKLIQSKLDSLNKRKISMYEESKKISCLIDELNRKHTEKYGTINSISQLETQLCEYEKSMNTYKTDRLQHESVLKQIEEWEKYQKQLENYNVWKDKVDVLIKQEKNARNEYAASTQLKDKILEAESVAMLNIIDSINTHARVYLDSFFPDNPICVQLQPFKETKKSTKPQINISIEYKGMEADMSMLSGGELSRVILAYTLALAEMFNTPLLLLDECTSSLDQDLTNTVFDSIRENFSGKITLVVAHQVITGTFDKVLCLDKMDTTVV